MNRIMKLKVRALKILLIILLVVTAFLHFIFLPTVSGGYNDECFLPDEKRRNLRTMVQNISRAFDKFGVEYWLDYGTLLGAYLMGDILPHDHDADISFLVSSDTSQAFHELAKTGIKAAGIKAKFRNVTLDFVPWRADNRTTNDGTEVMLHKAYPDYVLEKDNIVTRYHHTIQSFPQSWVVPSGRVNFHGVDVSIPNAPTHLLAQRYPYTFGTFRFQFPYKWKCWVPCWLRQSNGC